MGPSWTILWPECGLLDSLRKRKKKTFFLAVLKFGIKILNTHINLTTRPNIQIIIQFAYVIQGLG